MKPRIRLQVQLPKKLSDIGDSAAKIQASYAMFLVDRIKPVWLYVSNAETWDPEPMDIWPQRKTFRDALKEWCVSNGKTHQDAAHILGISLEHLQNAMYRKTKRLGQDVLVAAAKLFKKQIAEFIDDPAGTIEGEDVSHLSQEARFFQRLVVKGMSSEDLNDEDRRNIYEAVQREIQTLQRYKLIANRQNKG